MDGSFGLPAVKETRAMDAARFRNKAQERMLHEKVDRLEASRKTSAGKMTSQKSDVMRFLNNIPPSNLRCVVCPFGLSDRQRAVYRRIRRGFHPSMTLEQFDSKLAQLRHQRQSLRREGTMSDGGTADTAGIVDLGRYSFCSPLSKHKMTMREAFDRAVSEDVRFVNADKSPTPTPRKGFYSQLASTSSNEGMGDFSSREQDPSQRRVREATNGHFKQKGVPSDKMDGSVSFHVSGVAVKPSGKNLPSISPGAQKISR